MAGGAPRIHAELTKLGFIISEVTVSRYLPRRPAEPDELKRWVAFLRNHKHDIAAMDLFTVPTASLRLLYGFFVIKHGRRHIVHFNATFNPTAAWVMQQLREAFPYDRRTSPPLRMAGSCVRRFSSRASLGWRPRSLRSQSPEPAPRVIRQLLAGVDPALVICRRTAWNVQFPYRFNNDE